MPGITIQVRTTKSPTSAEARFGIAPPEPDFREALVSYLAFQGWEGTSPGEWRIKYARVDAAVLGR